MPYACLPFLVVMWKKHLQKRLQRSNQKCGENIRGNSVVRHQRKREFQEGGSGHHGQMLLGGQARRELKVPL